MFSSADVHFRENWYVSLYFTRVQYVVDPRSTICARAGPYGPWQDRSQGPYMIRRITTAADGRSAVRLAGSSSSREGRLEINRFGVWGTVCDHLFDYIDAGVVCNSLEFGLVFTKQRHISLSDYELGLCCRIIRPTIYGVGHKKRASFNRSKPSGARYSKASWPSICLYMWRWGIVII